MPQHERLHLYGKPSDLDPVEWDWVRGQLEAAGSYWLATPTSRHPHIRPVWGVWSDDQLHLSIGSPTLAASCRPGTPATVHLDSTTDVVIVEATVMGPTEASSLLETYNRKYDWDYTIEGYGPLTTLAPSKAMTWRSAGWAGRGGFRQSGRWRFA